MSESAYKGIALRDWMAGQAMAGDWAAQNEEVGEFSSMLDDEAFLKRARLYYRAADAMMEVRKEKE